MKNLSVLIVNYNSAEYLRKCLLSLPKYLSGLSYECCVIDNASEDFSDEKMASEFSDVHFISNSKNRGFAKAMNQGLRQTTAPWVLWLNPDTELRDAHWQECLQYFQQHPEVGILGSKIINPDGSLQLSCRSFPSYGAALFNRYSFLTQLFPKNPFSQKYLHTDWDHATIRKVDWVSGSVLLHRREVWEDLKGLDETFFMYCEDVDFCLRAKQKGWATVYYPGTVVMHHIGKSSRHLLRKTIWERHRSIWHYYRKHFPHHLLKDAVVGFGISLRFLFLWALSWIRLKREGA